VSRVRTKSKASNFVDALAWCFCATFPVAKQGFQGVFGTLAHGFSAPSLYAAHHFPDFSIVGVVIATAWVIHAVSFLFFFDKGDCTMLNLGDQNKGFSRDQTTNKSLIVYKK